MQFFESTVALFGRRAYIYGSTQEYATMPKIQPDEALLVEIRSFVRESGGASRAAAALGVEKTLLWRFCSSGRAIERNRSRLRDALSALKNATAKRNVAESTAAVAVEAAQHQISASNLKEMRALFQNMITLIDAYIDRTSMDGTLHEARNG
ncbi:hypothetical protein [Burkholderia ubonensis]|uniref:hypothetical protein n=1 Tax=Burkholderia ubonensis TaxID=101571 RepID=UPI000F56ADE2|nr:hypothetical protein [Burkholderia ubonensis]